MIPFMVYTFHTRVSVLNRDKHILQYTWQTILWCCATASNFIKYIFYSTRKRKTTRTELFDGISQQTPQLSRICGCLLWVQRLTPAALSHCVSYCIIMERITTVPSGVLLVSDRMLNIVSCSGLSLVWRQATFETSWLMWPIVIKFTELVQKMAVH